MKILHYGLGLPPARTGGLVQYTLDLIREQMREGDHPVLLYPGRASWLRKTMFIDPLRADKSSGITVVELRNPLPLALFGGIREPKEFMKNGDENIFVDFLKDFSPDVIHLHSLMGLPKEFLQAARKLAIPIVMTSHDYFGLAPEPTFFFNGKNYINKNTPEEWAKIGLNAFSTRKLRLFQSRMYPEFRSLYHGITAWRNQKHNNGCKTIKNKGKFSNDLLEDYRLLMNYYLEMYRCISFFLFNSTLSRSIYQMCLGSEIEGTVLCLSNEQIRPSFLKKNPHHKSRIAFIGQETDQKGFYDFLDISANLPPEKYEFHTYGYVPSTDYKGIIQHGRYTSAQIDNIYKNIDILVVPSRWNETLGFVTLEALSRNTPVVVSSHVGSKDLVPNKWIFESVADAISIIQENPSFDEFQGQLITISEHTKSLKKEYYKVFNYT